MGSINEITKWNSSDAKISTLRFNVRSRNVISEFFSVAAGLSLEKVCQAKDLNPVYLATSALWPTARGV